MRIDGFRLGNAVVAKIKMNNYDEDQVFASCSIGDQTRKRFYQQCSINERDATMLCSALGLNVYSFIATEEEWEENPEGLILGMGFSVSWDDEYNKYWKKVYDLDKIVIGVDKESGLWFAELSDCNDRAVSIADSQLFERAFMAIQLTDAVMRVRNE